MKISRERKGEDPDRLTQTQWPRWNLIKNHIKCSVMRDSKLTPELFCIFVICLITINLNWVNFLVNSLLLVARVWIQSISTYLGVFIKIWIFKRKKSKGFVKERRLSSTNPAVNCNRCSRVGRPGQQHTLEYKGVSFCQGGFYSTLSGMDVNGTWTHLILRWEVEEVRKKTK